MSDTTKHIRHVLSENPVTLFAASLFALFVVLAFIGPFIVPYDPLVSDSAAALKPPSWQHWFGTDAVGRDILSRTLIATRLDLASPSRPSCCRSRSASRWAWPRATSAAGGTWA